MIIAKNINYCRELTPEGCESTVRICPIAPPHNLPKKKNHAYATDHEIRYLQLYNCFLILSIGLHDQLLWWSLAELKHEFQSAIQRYKTVINNKATKILFYFFFFCSL